MKILVLVKHVPDTETRIKLSNGGKSLDTSEFKYMVNPYDEFGIEEAIRTQEKLGGESVVVTVGPARCQDALRKALAMGIDRAIWVNAEETALQDSFTTASVLAEIVKQEAPDVVFAGQMAIDDYASHIGPMLGELTGLPSIQVVTKIEWSDGGKTATVEREVEGGMVEIYKVTAPLIIGAHKSLNEPRFTSLPGIMKAKKKPLVEKALAEFGNIEAKVQILSCTLPEDKAPGKVFKGESVEEMVKKVVGLLRTEAKVL